MSKKGLKFLIAILSIITFTILFFIGIYYFNIFKKESSTNNEEITNIDNMINNKGKEENINNKVNLIKKIPSQKKQIIEKEENNSKTKDINTNDKENIKEEEQTGNKNKIKNVEKETEGIDEKTKRISKKVLKKIFYLSEDKKSFYFIVKFINKSFFIFKEGKSIYYIDLGKDNTNINIRKSYKEKINSIYDKNDLVNQKILFNLNKIINNKEEKNDNMNNSDNVTKLGSNLSSFLSWFISLDSNYYIYGSDIVDKLNMKVWYNYPLYGKINLSFNINRIIFINKLYQKNTNMWTEINKEINNNYNNLLFINFTNKELDFIINYFFKKVVLKKDENFYNIYKINIIEYKDFLLYSLLKKITYYIDNKKDKKIQKEIRNLSKNKVLKNIFYAYYRQIKKYRQIDAFDIKEIIFVDGNIETLPVQDKNKIDEIIDNINKLLIIKK